LQQTDHIGIQIQTTNPPCQHGMAISVAGAMNS